MTTPAPAAAPSNNGAAAKAAPAAPPPIKDATGPQTPVEAKTKPPSPVDDDPEMDFGDVKLKRSAAKRELERGRNSGRLLQEAEKRNKAAEAREKVWEERKAKKDLDGLVDELGLSAEEERELFSKRLYSKHIAPEQMTAEQKRIIELEAYQSKHEAEKKKASDDAASKKKSELSEQESKKLHAELIAAAEAGKIPKSRRAIQRIMDKAIAFDSRGMELPLEQIAALVRDDMAQDVGDYTDATSIEERKSFLGPERFKAEEKKWLKHFQSQIRTVQPTIQPVRAPPQRDTDGKFKRDTLTPQEFMARLKRT